MGTHRRSGHWRRSKNGNVHWVSGHDVTRESWSSTPVPVSRPTATSEPSKPASFLPHSRRP